MKTRKAEDGRAYIRNLLANNRSASYLAAARAVIELVRTWLRKDVARLDGADVDDFVKKLRERAKSQREKRYAVQQFQELRRIARFYERHRAVKCMERLDIGSVLDVDANSRKTEDWSARALTTSEFKRVKAYLMEYEGQSWIRPIFLLYAATGWRTCNATAPC